MGLIKKDGYLVKGVDIIPAYAKIMRIYLDANGNASAVFGISTTKRNLDAGNILEEIPFNCSINKENKVYQEIYTKAKEEIFLD